MAIDAQIGADYTIGAYFENADGPITGKAANFVVTVTNRLTGSAVTSGAPTETPASSGYYEFTVDNQYHTARARFFYTFVDATDELRAEGFYAVGDVPSWARTRREVRRRLASRLAPDGQVWQERASSSASNSTTVAYLPRLTVAGENEYRGTWVWLGSGSNRHLERRATDWAQATSLLTWTPAATAATAANDLVELYPSGLRPSRLNDAIADAIADLAGIAMTEVDEGAYTTDGTVTEWALPSDARFVYRVGVIRSSDSLFLHWLPTSTWTLLPNRILRVVGGSVGNWLEDPLEQHYREPLAIPEGYRLRVLMLCAPDPPLYDDSTIDIDPSAVVDLAAYQLVLADGARRAEWPFWERAAHRARQRAATPLPAGSLEVQR